MTLPKIALHPLAHAFFPRRNPTLEWFEELLYHMYCHFLHGNAKAPYYFKLPLQLVPLWEHLNKMLLSLEGWEHCSGKGSYPSRCLHELQPNFWDNTSLAVVLMLVQ